MLIPKQDRLRDPKWLIALRDYPCLLTGSYATDYMSIDPHHIMHGRTSLSLKAPDNQAIPLRHDLHAKIGTKEYPTEHDLVRDWLSDAVLARLLKAEAWKLWREWHDNQG